MDEQKWSGTLAVLETWTADGRRLARPLISLRHRELPMPLFMCSPHDRLGSPTPVGTIDTVEAIPGDHGHDRPPHVWATGRVDVDQVRDVDPGYAARLEAGQPCGIGVDLDQVVSVFLPGEPAPRAADVGAADPLAVVFHEPATPPPADDERREQINGWRIIWANLHDNPAWPHCLITLDHVNVDPIGAPTA